jgi:hypothetical protein
MEETVRTMGERQRPQRDEAFWAGYFDRLAPQLGAAEPRHTRVHHAQSLVRHPAFRIGAAAALILVGIALGRWIWPQRHVPTSPSAPTALSPRPDHRPVATPAARAEAYFQNSKVLLLALANFDPATDSAATLNFPTQRRISETLVQEAVYLKSEFTNTAERRLHELVEDLEVILLQIANLENEHDLAAIEMVRTSVTNQALLFRIDLSQMSREVEDPSYETLPETENTPTI